MSTDLKLSNPKPEIVTMIFKVLPELEEGEIANEEPTISSPHLKVSHSHSKDGKSSSKKHQKSSSKHKIHTYSTSSDSESSDQDEHARKGWWNKKKLHVGGSSQHSSSKSKEDDSDDDSEYIEKPMPDFASFRNKKKKFKKRKNNNNNNNKKNYHHHNSHKTREISNASPLTSPSKEKEEKPETKKRNLYPCRSYIAFGKCDDINCHCIHAPLNKEEISRFIDENEEFFSNAFKALPITPINPTLIPLLTQKFPSTTPQNSLNLNLNLNNNSTYIPRQMPPPNFISPQTLHNQYQIFTQSPTNMHPVYSFPVPQVISPQQANLSPRFPAQPIYANPSIYFEFNMQQNLTYLPQNPQFFSHPQMLVPATFITPQNFQPEIKANNTSPLKVQSTASVNIFTASSNNKDLLLQAPQSIGRRRSSIETAPGSETYEVIGNEKGISPESGQEDELKKAKTAEKITRLVELFKAKNPLKEVKIEESPSKSSEKNSSEEKNKGTPKMTEDEMFKQWEEPKTQTIKSKFDNGSANDELLKKIKSALSENPTQSGSGNVKDLVNMYLKLSKNLIAENNSVH